MKRSIRSQIALAAILSMAGGVGFAQSSGADLYKAKCQMCHGATGMADTGPAKTMKVKPVSDPDVKKHTEAEMTAITKNGEGKMPAYKDKLTDAQIKDVVGYFRSLMK